jgi:hypothetical protein
LLLILSSIQMFPFLSLGQIVSVLMGNSGAVIERS